MCYRWCGDPDREHEPNDNRSRFCVTCLQMVSDDFQPFRSDEWRFHVEDTGHTQFVEGEVGEQIELSLKVVGDPESGTDIQLEDIVTVDVDHWKSDDDPGALTVTGFATIGEQGIIALTSDGSGYYAEALTVVGRQE